jgi:hypothetical protein
MSFLVSDILDDARMILGICDNTIVYRRLTEAIELLVNKCDFDFLTGCVDICTDGCVVTLPRDVENLLAVNISGMPALPGNQLFQFHQNGSGSGPRCDYRWIELGSFPTYRDLTCASKLVAFLDNPADGSVKLVVHGYDHEGKVLTHTIAGVQHDGALIPMTYGYALPASDAPKISRITGISKGISKGMVRLSSFDGSTTTGTLIGIYEPDEQYPTYRRITINPECEVITVLYRKSTFEVRRSSDRILLHSRLALLLALKAVKAYQDDMLDLGVGFEKTATRIIMEKEERVGSSVQQAIQVQGGPGDPDDQMS